MLKNRNKVKRSKGSSLISKYAMNTKRSIVKMLKVFKAQL